MPPILEIYRSLIRNRIPGQLVIQITDRCNAKCPQCGMRVTESFPRSTLETDTIKKIIDAAARQGVQAISFTGGEPLLDIDRLADLIRYAGSAGIPYIRSGTNGFMFSQHEKEKFSDRIKSLVEKLANTPLRNFWISLDSGVDVFHEKMRGFPGVVAGIEKALPIFHNAGIFPAVNLGINRNVGGDSTRNLLRKNFASDEVYHETFRTRYRKAFEGFYQRAIDLGFTTANTCYPMSVDSNEIDNGLSAVYGATTVDDVVHFTDSEKELLFRSLIPAIQKFRSKLRIFSPMCSLEALVRRYDGSNKGQKPYGCRGGTDFFFIDASDGFTYPCGYRGNENHGHLWEMDLRRISPEKENSACRKCDWECFRDPSEMFGPILSFFSNPLLLLRNLLSSPKAYKTWLEDLRYYRACDFFDGRRPPDAQKLARFSSAFHPGIRSISFSANSH